MGKRIDYLKEINQAFGLIMDGTRQFVDLAGKIEDKNLKHLIATAGKDYAHLNYSLSLLLLALAPDICKKDQIDTEFNSLMKPLEDEFKELDGN